MSPAPQRPPWPLRVTMVNKYYSPPHLGGVETVVRTLAEGLVEHAGARVRTLVSNESRRLIQERLAGVEVTRLPRHLRLSSAPVALGMRRALRAEVNSGSPDTPDTRHIVDLHSPYPWGELCFLEARLDVPSVVHYHSDIVRQRMMLVAYKPFLEAFLDRVDLIVTASPDLIAGSSLLAPRASKCRVVPYGLPLEHLATDKDIERRAAALRAQHGERRLILFAGRLVYYKGLELLLEAMVGVDADLVLIGEGPLRAALGERAAALGLTPRVAFLPHQVEPELAAWYRAADVFCLPSVARSEAFGLVQIEAHAAGTPVVSTRLTTGVPFANQDGVTGLTVAPGDAPALRGALNRLLTDDELRSRLGRQAQTRALHDFTVPRMVADTVKVYEEAIERHAARGAAGHARSLGSKLRRHPKGA